MTLGPLTLARIDAQEAVMAAAFAVGDVSATRGLYQDDVVYCSPTTRLFGWPERVVGVERALEFIALTIAGVSRITYTLDERAVIAGATDTATAAETDTDRGAYVRAHFDFDVSGARLRSTYVVVYRYRDGLIAQQELYYDPSATLGPPPA